MTQAEFAERIGISQNYLSTIEHGTVEIGAEILLRIGRSLGRVLNGCYRGRGGICSRRWIFSTTAAGEAKELIQFVYQKSQMLQTSEVIGLPLITRFPNVAFFKIADGYGGHRPSARFCGRGSSCWRLPSNATNKSRLC
jgi:transcriptional regulator with XRE-family HTH domain